MGGEAPVTPVSSPNSSFQTFPTNRAITSPNQVRGAVVDLVVSEHRIINKINIFLVPNHGALNVFSGLCFDILTSNPYLYMNCMLVAFCLFFFECRPSLGGGL